MFRGKMLKTNEYKTESEGLLQALEAVGDDVGVLRHEIAGMRCGEADDEGSAGAGRLEAVDTVLEDDAIARFKAVMARRTDIAVGVRLAAACVFGREYVVEEARQMGQLLGERLHLLLVAARDDGATDAALRCRADEVLGAVEELVDRLVLEGYEAAINLLAECCVVGKVVVVDGHECRALDTRGEVGNLGQKFASDGSPEALVLALGIDDHAVEVKEIDAHVRKSCVSAILARKVCRDVVVETLADLGSKRLACADEGIHHVSGGSLKG